jgi:hypothetical protein
MVLDTKAISLYEIVHDWWGVGAFGLTLYKAATYLKGFKDTTEKALAAAEDVKADLAAGRGTIREELARQTGSIVNGQGSIVSELREMRQDFRTMFLTQQPRAAKARRTATEYAVAVENSVDKSVNV